MNKQLQSRNFSRRRTYTVRPNLYFKNRMNEGSYFGDLIDEEEIDGKTYYVVKINGKVQKLSKEAFVIVRKDR